MVVSCSNCKRKIGSENINVAKDIAYCTNCENLTSLSTLIESTPGKNFDAHSPVSGTWVDDRGYNWAVSGSHRSWMALIIVPFTVVWSGVSLSGIYGHQIVEGEFDPVKTLFGLPFLIGSIVLITVSLMSLFSRTILTRHKNISG